jgi:hypothetical protein
MLLNLSQIGPIAAPQPVLVLALMSGFAIEVGPRCTGAAPASANVSIGGAIKVAGASDHADLASRAEMSVMVMVGAA